MKILVHLHIFYQDQIPYFLEKLQVLRNYDWDLLVSYPDISEESRETIIRFKPDTIFRQVENLGYDIVPFLKMLRSVNLDNYDYIIKLHTKSRTDKGMTLNHISFTDYSWRDYAVNAFLKDGERFEKVLSLFKRRGKVGIVCSCEMFMIAGVSSLLPEDNALLDNELKRLGIHTRFRGFCAGSIFMARSSALKCLTTLDIDFDSFKGVQVSHASSTMSHVYERLIFIAVHNAGYKIVRMISNDKLRWKMFIDHYVTTPLRGKIFSIYRTDPDRQKYVCIFGMHFKVNG